MPSERATATTPFAAMDVLERAGELDDVVHMEVGEPDFRPPAAATDAAVEALRAGDDDYTSSRGTRSLRDAISGYYATEYGVTVPAERIVVTPGSSPALLVSMLSTVDPGEDVVLTDPHYACYPNFVRLADGTVRTVDLDPADGFEPNVADYETVVDDDTAAMLLNSPGNPTGAVMDGDTLSGLVDLADRTDTAVVSDEVYHGLAFDAEEHSVLEYTDDAFVLDGVSKRYGMTGWRLGWVVCPPEYVDAVNRIAQNALICAPSFVQAGAEAAIREGTGWLPEVREDYRERRDILLEAAERWGFDLGYTPEGAYYVLLDVSDLGDPFDVADVFLEDAGVAMTPGPDFGENAATCLRASFATSTENVRDAVDRIDALLADTRTTTTT
ncbi:pyridoxal phosphate-dependent aminotransferase [Halobacterium rubrum]|uniref:pyridoxal phosphate-dependent aminotransferase n=1 Tax=Halobacterium TaxID=2239 RepID=UPI001EFFAC38|nr:MULTISPECIES: aminotransferase class I/II-fold pyridoxal phosphate-dependent enzyme [Halobacterium]MDH5019906.1 aminotransferase class I/II-fold pyridoxal phosphate-dependent enzyme [Halobacterium rubrum]